MATHDHHLDPNLLYSPRVDPTWPWLAAGFAIVALLIGVGTAIDPRLGFIAFAVAIAVPATVVQPKLVALLFVVVVFFGEFYGEALSAAGITPNRAVAPLGLLAVLVQLHNAPPVMPDASRTLLAVGAYALWAVASLAWTVDPTNTIYTLASLAIALVFMAVFGLVIRDARDLRHVLVAVMVSATVLALWWIGSYLAGIDRFENPAGDPNYFAAYQVVALPLVLVLASSTRSPLRSGLLYVSATLITLSIVSTLSRGGVLTLAVAGLLMMFLPANTLFRSRTQKVALAIATLIALAAMLSIAWTDLTSRFGVQHGRQGLWLAALQGYGQNPATGLGYGAFKGVSFNLLSNTPGADLEEHLATALLEGREVHNVYVGSLAELGPLGLLLFVAVLIAAWRSFRRTAEKARLRGDDFVRSVAVALGVGLTSFAVASLFLSSETRTGLWMLIGLSLALPRTVSDPPETQPLRPLARPS